MNLLRRASHLGVNGASGMGKTSYLERYVSGSHHGRVFVYDWQSELFDRFGVEPATDFAELMDVIEHSRLVVFDPTAKFGGSVAEVFDQFCQVALTTAKAWQIQYGMDSLLVVDELQRLISPNLTPPPLKEILQTGRRSGLDTCIVSQQPNKIHNEIRAQWTEVVCFRLQDRTVSELLENWGFDVEEIAKLPEHHYRWINTRTGERRSGEVKFGN